MKYIILSFIGYILLSIQGGYWLQDWLHNNYIGWINSPLNDGWTSYIAPYDFSWGWYIFTCICLFMIIVSLIALFIAIRQERRHKICSVH